MEGLLDLFETMFNHDALLIELIQFTGMHLLLFDVRDQSIVVSPPLIVDISPLDLLGLTKGFDQNKAQLSIQISENPEPLNLHHFSS